MIPRLVVLVGCGEGALVMSSVVLVLSASDRERISALTADMVTSQRRGRLPQREKMLRSAT